jgi:hypothetical protein
MITLIEEKSSEIVAAITILRANYYISTSYILSSRVKFHAESKSII